MEINSGIPSFKEDHISQVPALQLLINLGYTYLSPEEALIARGNKTSNVIFESILGKNYRRGDSFSKKTTQTLRALDLMNMNI